MSFQTVDASTRTAGRTSSPDPIVSFYGKTSQFRLSSGAMAVLGENTTKLECMYDPESQQIAFLPSDAAYAVSLRKDSDNQKTRYFGFRGLANLAGLTENDRFALPLTATEVDGKTLFIIDLSQRNTDIVAPPTARRGRRPAAAAEEVPAAAEAAA